MQKADVIAKCLLQSAMVSDLEAGRLAVQNVFENSYPTKSYVSWNTRIDQKAADSILKAVGRAKTINVEKFIADLA